LKFSPFTLKKFDDENSKIIEGFILGLPHGHFSIQKKKKKNTRNFKFFKIEYDLINRNFGIFSGMDKVESKKPENFG